MFSENFRSPKFGKTTSPWIRFWIIYRQAHLGSDWLGPYRQSITKNIEISNVRTSAQVCAQRLPQCLSSPNIKSIHLIFASIGQGASKTLASTRLPWRRVLLNLAPTKHTVIPRFETRSTATRILLSEPEHNDRLRDAYASRYAMMRDAIARSFW